MIRNLDVQHAGEDPVFSELIVQCLQGLGVAGQCGCRGAVDRRDTHCRSKTRGPALGFLGIQTDREHAARARRLGLQPGAMEGNRSGVAQGQRATHVRRGDLTNTVSYHRGGPDPELPQMLCQCRLDQEIRRLGDLGAADTRVPLGPQQFGDYRPARDLLEHRVDLGCGVTEDTRGLQQSARHPPPLRAHPAEDEHGIGDALDESTRRRRFLAFRIGIQLCEKVIGIAIDEALTQIMLRPTAGGRGLQPLRTLLGEI